MTKAKNVLMTTLSTLNNNQRLNYYFCSSPNPDGTTTSRLLSGVFTTEIGSKYLLSTVKIDKIVVIGSKETIKKKPRKNSRVPRNLQKVNLLKELPVQHSSNASGSAYMFYLEQLRSFLMLNSSENPTSPFDACNTYFPQISSQRAIQIQDIVTYTLEQFKTKHNGITYTGKNIEKALITPGNPDDVFKTLEKSLTAAIATDINNSFTQNLSSVDSSYEQRLQQIGQETTDLFASLNKLSEERKAIESDATLTVLDKQLLYLLIKEKIKHILTKLKSNSSKAKFEQTKHNLFLEIYYLDKELEKIKSNRLITETNYAKNIVYTQFKNEYKFFPLEENKKGAGPLVVFVDESILSGEDNLHEISSAICESNEPVNLYIDMQGGNRTSGYVRNAVLSMLTNQINAPVSIQKIIATNFAPQNWLNEIVDETKRYKILDLVSGMNAFIRYGKADIIKNYCETVSVPRDTKFHELVDLMVSIDHALCLCDVNTLYSSIKALREHFSTSDVIPNDKFANIYQVLRGGIELDYGPLIQDTQIEYVDLIDWAIKKGFTQQALTLIEDKMPSVFFEKKWLTRPTEDELTDEQKKFLKEIGPHYKLKDDNLFFYILPNKRAKEDKVQSFYKLWTFFKATKDNQEREEIPPSARFSDLKAHLSKNKYRYEFNSNAQFYPIIENTRASLMKCNANTSDVEFIFLYCMMRSLTKLYYNTEDHYNIYDFSSEQFFYIMKKKKKQEKRDFSCKDPDISFTILACIGTQQYKKNNNDTQELTFDFGLHSAFTCDHCSSNCSARIPNGPCVPLPEDCRQRMLEEFFLLHHALKNERNCNNHAFEQDERLSKEIVDNAIRIYIKRFRKLQEFIDATDTPS